MFPLVVCYCLACTTTVPTADHWHESAVSEPLPTTFSAERPEGHESTDSRDVSRPDIAPSATGMAAGFFDIPVSEPSGISYHPKRQTLFVVSDNGGLIELDLGLKVRQRFWLRGDLEGVAVHPILGTIYIASESARALYEYDVEERRVLREFKIDFASHEDFAAGVDRNRGLEGVTVVEIEDQTHRLYAVVEANPARLIVLSADISSHAIDKARRRVAENPVAEPIKTVANITASYDLGLERMSGITFEQTSRMIVVISASEKVAKSCDLSGRVHRYVEIPGRKVEGVCFVPQGAALFVQDTDTGGLWVCDDILARLGLRE